MFRLLWRSTRQVFGQDERARQEAATRIRVAFRSSKATRGKEKAEQLLIARDTAALLKQTVMQAHMSSSGESYKTAFEPRHSPSMT